MGTTPIEKLNAPAELLSNAFNRQNQAGAFNLTYPIAFMV
jgi:hypothetical protein